MNNFCSVALLLATCPVSAQVSRPAARPDSLTGPLATSPAAPDTVAALHRLFAAKRRRQVYVMGGTTAIGAATIALIGTAAKPYSGGSSGYGSLSSGPLLDFTGFEQMSAGVLAALLLGGEAFSYRNYTREAEQRAVVAAQLHKLPQTLQRQLKAKYFRPTKAIP